MRKSFFITISNLRLKYNHKMTKDISYLMPKNKVTNVFCYDNVFC